MERGMEYGKERNTMFHHVVMLALLVQFDVKKLKGCKKTFALARLSLIDPGRAATVF